jgi:alkylation response protein AidB-like acyl-CoA dehydrogenase
MPANLLLRTLGEGFGESVHTWWANHAALATELRRPADLALVGGLKSERLAWAFASGYQAAIHAAIPSLPADEPAALCVTEARGGHPRAIEATLRRREDGRLVASGQKTTVTLGNIARHLVVVLREGDQPNGRPALRAVVIPADRAGVSVSEGLALPFAPELPHGALTLDDVTVEPDELLPHDAYEGLVRPFRTVEDLHVLAATLGFLVREARLSEQSGRLQQLLILAVATRDLCAANPSDPAVHVTLGGLLTAVEDAADQANLTRAARDPEAAERFDRDRPLLLLANRARAARLDQAWTSVGIHQHSPNQGEPSEE